jgi:hypothetical protein
VAREPIFTAEFSRQLPVIVLTLAIGLAVIYGLHRLTQHPLVLHILGIGLLCYFVIATIFYAIHWWRT